MYKNTIYKEAYTSRYVICTEQQIRPDIFNFSSFKNRIFQEMEKNNLNLDYFFIADRMKIVPNL